MSSICRGLPALCFIWINAGMETKLVTTPGRTSPRLFAFLREVEGFVNEYIDRSAWIGIAENVQFFHLLGSWRRTIAISTKHLVMVRTIAFLWRPTRDRR